MLGLSEFFFPNRMENVYSGLFHFVDNLGELCNFKWGQLFIHIWSKGCVELRGPFTESSVRLFVWLDVFTCWR